MGFMGFFTKKQKNEIEELSPRDCVRSKEALRPYTKTKAELEDEKWEQRRWELVRSLVAQDRRSVILGKLNLSEKAIARKARLLADATINELRAQSDEGNGRQE